MRLCKQGKIPLLLNYSFNVDGFLLGPVWSRGQVEGRTCMKEAGILVVSFRSSNFIFLV